MVEQRTENPRVGGSTPLLGTMYVVISSNLSREQKTILAVMLVMERLQGPRELLHSGQESDRSRSGGMVDAAVSKTVGGQPPCRFESDLRHQDLGFAELS